MTINFLSAIYESVTETMCLLTSSLIIALMREKKFLSLLFQLARSLGDVGLVGPSTFNFNFNPYFLPAFSMAYPSQTPSRRSLKISILFIFLSHSVYFSLPVKTTLTMEFNKCILHLTMLDQLRQNLLSMPCLPQQCWPFHLFIFALVNWN